MWELPYSGGVPFQNTNEHSRNFHKAGVDPGILIGGGGGVQTLVQKGLLNVFVANYFSATPPPPPVAEKAETTTCFSICERRSPLAREILKS